MTDEQMNDLMAYIISTYAAPYGILAAKASKRAALKLATANITETATVSAPDAYMRAKTALSHCGTILEEDDTEQVLSGLIMSGSLNMNPSIVVIWVDGNCIHIKASAKEGLIKQHTAEKAIAIFKSAL